MRCSAAAGLRHGLQRQVQPIVVRPFLSSSPASNPLQVRQRPAARLSPPEPLADTFMQLIKPRSPDPDINPHEDDSLPA